jgi:hypothetical protein
MRTAILALALMTGGQCLVACQSSDVSRELGARCDLNAECDERCLTPSTDWPGGFCTITCDSDADCPSDAACVNEENSAVCAYTCMVDAGCAFLGAGYKCSERDHHSATAGKVFVCRGG